MTDGTGAALESDVLPTFFPMQVANQTSRYSVTFSLKNNQGTMLLAFDWLRQRTQPPRITELYLEDTGPLIDFQSLPGLTYTIEFSTNLAEWALVEANHPDQGYSTSYSDHGIYERFVTLPSQGFYRVTENR